MRCPKCKSKAIVDNTKSSDKEFETIRYHTCLNEKCGNKFTTVERLKSGWKHEDRLKNLIKSVKKVLRDYEEG